MCTVGVMTFGAATLMLLNEYNVLWEEAAYLQGVRNTLSKTSEFSDEVLAPVKSFRESLPEDPTDLTTVEEEYFPEIDVAVSMPAKVPAIEQQPSARNFPFTHRDGVERNKRISKPDALTPEEIDLAIAAGIMPERVPAAAPDKVVTHTSQVVGSHTPKRVVSERLPVDRLAADWLFLPKGQPTYKTQSSPTPLRPTNPASPAIPAPQPEHHTRRVVVVPQPPILTPAKTLDNTTPISIDDESAPVAEPKKEVKKSEEVKKVVKKEKIVPAPAKPFKTFTPAPRTQFGKK
jgi:hypothetical protein